VLVFHVLILSETFENPTPGFRPDEPSWWLTHTPLSLSWAGVGAVLLFFVQRLRARPAHDVVRDPVAGVHPQRFLRLYLPVWASLAFAAALVALVPREPQTGLNA
jgi:hypothetical protein